MAGRVFDRRGRANWDEGKREVEDKRLRERRKGGDRRVAGSDANYTGPERRKGERRKSQSGEPK